MGVSLLLPELHNELLGFTGIQEQIIVSTPCGYVLYLFSVVRLIIITDDTNISGVICKLVNGVVFIHRPAVKGEIGGEE